MGARPDPLLAPMGRGSTRKWRGRVGFPSQISHVVPMLPGQVQVIGPRSLVPEFSEMQKVELSPTFRRIPECPGMCPMQDGAHRDGRNGLSGNARIPESLIDQHCLATEATSLDEGNRAGNT